MISIFPSHLSNKYSVLIVALFLFLSPFAMLYAQTAQSLSVSPTLFEMSANPKQEWRSTIRIVNPNPYELTVYVSAVNFEPKGEAGDGTLLPILTQESDGLTLAEWIEYNHDPIVIPAEKSFDLPFTVAVPAEASPGGHFAAFMVGTVPPKNDVEATRVRTSQVVTSLFFLRVAGDVTEEGTIREFSTSRMFYQKPEVEFNVRFENKGNVHLRPQGDIVITNMWGQERGVIPINHQSHFGNVLPNSTRKFTFSWRSDWSITDMGRYSAVATLAYGSDERKFVTSKTYYWVIPIIPLTAALGSLLFAAFLVSWLVRRYVRKMLAVSGVSPIARARFQTRLHTEQGDLALRPVATVTPVTHKKRLIFSLFTKARSVCTAVISLLLRAATGIRHATWKTILVVLGLLILASAFTIYIYIALTPQRSYEVTFAGGNGQVSSVTSDEILYEQHKPEETAVATTTELLPVTVINTSGVGGLGATVAVLLKQAGYDVAEVGTELGAEKGRTVIVFSPKAEAAALAISPLLKNALLSGVTEVSATATPITIFVGKDMAQSQ